MIPIMKKLLLIFLLFSDAALSEVKVIDGDSLEINGVRTRLDGIDAPEFFQTCSTADGQDYACGQEAKMHLQDLISKNAVECHCLPDLDKYKRQICECFVEDVSLNKAMVRDGFAQVYRDEKYDEDEEIAAAEHRGIWQGKHMRPALYRILNRSKR